VEAGWKNRRMSIIWHNGRFTQEAPVFLPNDRVRIGDGVFDTMLAVDGALIHANEHFKRLLGHADILKIKTDWSVSDLKAAADGLLEQNKGRAGKFAVNTIITRGPGVRGLKIPESSYVQAVMSVSPVGEFPPVHAVIASVRRNEGSPLSRIKSSNYGDNILALAEAADKGANEAIMLNNRGNVACASASNIFIVRDGKLLTPKLEDGAVDGITRRNLIKKHGATEKNLTADDFAASEGLYLTSSIRGIVAVETLDGKKLPRPSLEIDKEFHLI
jgi:branched-subunit amino acid aminotransferase/4-amino-4-deoxychorismate lyase